MTLTRRVAYNTVVQVLGKAVTTLLSLFVIAALTRRLGVAGYGEYTTVFGYVAFLGVLADFGFFWILVRELAKEEEPDEKVVNNILTLRFFLGVVVFAVGFFVGLFIPQYNLQVKIGIGIIGLAWLWTALNSTFVGVFQNKLRMDKAALSDVIGRVVILGGVLYLVRNGAGLAPIFWVYVLGNFINFTFSMALGWRYVHFRPAFDLSYWRRVFWEAAPMGVVLILGVVYFRIDVVLLSLIKGETDVGIYGPPYKIFEILLAMPLMFLGNVFPILTRYYAKKDTRFPVAFQRSFDFLSLLAPPAMIGIILLASPIIRLVAGQEFVLASTVPNYGHLMFGAPLVLQLLSLALGISFFSSFFNYLIIALGRQRMLVGPYVIFVATNIIFNLLLIPKFSYVGAAFVTFITEVVVLVILARITFRLLNLRPKLKILWRSLLAAVLMAVVLSLGSGLHLFLLIFLGILVYFGVLLVTRTITSQDLRTLLPGA